jgi:hypothetical protein
MFLAAGVRSQSSVRAGVNVGEKSIRLAIMRSVRETRECGSYEVAMGPSITSAPKSRAQKIVWWCAFTAMMSFIVYVIFKNIFS